GRTRAAHRAGPQVHPGRRLPAPDRPDADRLMSDAASGREMSVPDTMAGFAGVVPPGEQGGGSSPREITVALPKLPGAAVLSVRAFRCWLLAYRRTWR